MSWQDLPYHLLLAGCSGWFLFNLRRQRSLPLALVLGLPAFAALILAAVFSRDGFDFMRLVGLAIFFYGPVVLAVTTWLLARVRPLQAVGCAVTALLLVAIYVDAYHYEPWQLEVNHVRVRARGARAPLRIAVLADIQTDSVGVHEQRAVAAAFAEHPDLILLPGDHLQVYGPERRAQIEPWRRLFREARPWPPRGVWAVGGNVDPEGWEQIFDGTLVERIVTQRTVDLGDGLFLTGLDLDASFDHELLLARPAGARYHVVFGHAPDYALGRVDADLLIAGHTHGGQVQLPLVGPLLTLSSVPRAWAAGVTALDQERSLVVSRGVGLERGNAPRLRFLCRPEVVIVEVPAGS